MPRICFGGFVLVLAASLWGGCSSGHPRQAATQKSRPLLAPKAAASSAASASPRLAPTSRGASPADPSSEKLARAHAHFAAGVIYEMNEESDAALNEYYLAALNDPANETLILDVTRRFLQRKQPEKALEILIAAAQRPNVSGVIYARLGLVYGHLGKTDQAIAANRTAIARSPQGLAGYQNLFVTLLQNKKADEALKVLDEASKQTTADPEFQVGIGELYANYAIQSPSQKQKIQSRALAVLDRARKAGSADATLRLHMAEAYDVLGVPEKAAEVYLDLLKKLPDLPMIRDQLHAKLAGLYMRVSDRTNAIAQLQAIVLDDPTNPQAYYYLGFLSYGDKKPSEAIEYLNKAILLNPGLAEAYYQLALAQLSLNKSKEAIETLDIARKRSPDNFLLEFYSGLAWSEQKDYATALRYFTAAEVFAKATEPRLLDREFYFQLGACYERTGDFGQAEQYFQKCLDMSPDWAEACNYLGYMWAERGTNLDKARELIEKAVKAEPKNAAFLDSLAWILYKQNQPQEALKQVQQALDLSEKPDPTVLDHLGDILTALKQPERAREAWQKSLSLERNEVIQKKLDSAPAQ